MNLTTQEFRLLATPPHQTTPPARPALTRGHYALLAAGFVAFVIYGSLVPFHYQPLPFDEAADRFRDVCARPVRVESRSDWLANIVLFVPLGFVLMAALCADRRRTLGLAAALAVLPACVLLSVTVEFAQLWFPPRVSSLNDIVAESSGGLLGMLIWISAGQPITNWARGVWTTLGTHGLAARLLPGYLFFLVLLHALPFDLTISPAALWHKYRAGRIVLVPFAEQGDNLFHTIQQDLWNVALFLPLGLLLGLLPGRWQTGRSWPLVLAAGLAAAALMQFVKLFVVPRWCLATDVVTGAAAVLAGWGMTLLYHRSHAPATRPAAAPASQAGIRLLLLSAWLAIVVFVNWQPFDFRLDLPWAADRLTEVSLLPFADYYRGNYWNGLDQCVHKTLLFVPLGALLALAGHCEPAGSPRRSGEPAGSSRRTTPPALRVLLTAAAVAALIEAGQLFLPTRYASLTDVLVETGGAWLGFAAARHARTLLLSPPSRCLAMLSSPLAPASGERGRG